jgi:hypothetical protein
MISPNEIGVGDTLTVTMNTVYQDDYEDQYEFEIDVVDVERFVEDDVRVVVAELDHYRDDEEQVVVDRRIRFEDGTPTYQQLRGGEGGTWAKFSADGRLNVRKPKKPA